MKTLRVVMTILGFALAISAAFCLEFATKPKYGIYGEDSLGRCIAAPETMETGCNATGGDYQCTVYLEESSEITFAYGMQVNSLTCALPLWRW